MEEYFRGTTIRLTLTVRNTTAPHALADPDGGCTLDIWGPDKEEILTAGSMTKSSTGIYYYDWTPAKDYEQGTYTARGFAIDGDPATYSVDEYQFSLK